ncbi:GNAT family N-acetyltransferase [Gracilibacillus marinus]|uniref:GNAT family N-acetyltransferase n=1 Tax=Gracilibacillus marinus TaxID=630535 RepID=A0ABV8VQZ0_9BACI
MKLYVVENDKQLEDAFQVRREVFVKEQGVPIELEIDDKEQDATHFIGYVEDKPIAASRVRFGDDYVKLERICIMKSVRGKHFGKDLVLFMESYAKEKNITKSKLHAQVYAIPFYEKLGYVVTSGEFDDAGIPHVSMKKEFN